MTTENAKELEEQIYQLTNKLQQLRKDCPGEEVKNYTFQTIDGEVTLLDLFAGKDRLLAIHNMGQGCRYCTLWADGINPFIPHLESVLSVVMLSKDDPQTQRRFANARNWRFRTASHLGGDYITEQSTMEDKNNMPGVVFYELKENKIYRKSSSNFGPGDLYCSIWNFLGLAGISAEDWTPQYSYWRRPEKMDDGGQNIQD